MRASWININTATAPPPRSGASFAYDHNSQSVILFGGLAGGHGLNDTWSFDGTNWRELNPRRRPSPRHSSPMAWSPRGSHLVLLNGIRSQPTGGDAPLRGISMSNLHDTWVFDGKEWEEVRPSQYPSYAQQVLTTDPGSDLVVAFGGLRAGPKTLIGVIWPKEPGLKPLVDETWVFDGSVWERRVPQLRPPARNFATMAPHPRSSGVVLFGGQGDQQLGVDDRRLNDTWVFDGKEWEEVRTPTAPSPRTQPTLTYDSIVGHCVLFGGTGRHDNGSLVSLNDTWVFDGKAWVRVQTASAPSPRCAATMTFDEMNGQVVLFGGSEHRWSSTPLNDTWILEIEE
ncbi:MAG: Kelch repeat-containing protein [Ferrimicrobium sp.]